MSEVANTNLETQKLAESEKKPTTAGNYFVSNYPPYSFWKPDHVGEFLEAIERPPST
jgi:oxygen-independent coproporphyrinogen-3 oxidase